MRRRMEHCIPIFLVTLVLQGIISVNGEYQSSGSHVLGSNEQLLDLEGTGLLTNLLGTVSNIGKNITSTIDELIQCGNSYPQACQNSRYRSIDGSCNNLKKPTWGMANTRFGRLLPPNYGDGIQTPTKSSSGADLPLPRLISYTLDPNFDVDDPRWTLAAMQWGQFITHDMSMSIVGPQSGSPLTQCCTNEGQLMEEHLHHGQCYPVIIPQNDPFYSGTNVKCFNFVRTLTDLDHGCPPRSNPAEQVNGVTHFLDLSLVYGSSNEMTMSLRAGLGGRLNVDIRGNKQWPPQAVNKSQLCDITTPNDICYKTGDNRANQSPHLIILQIILLREHNRIADALARINPHWTDETIFQEARRIAIAEMQHITYYEWLPIFLGTQTTYGNGILYQTKNYVNDYDPDVDPSVLNEHTTAAFRYFHSLIAGHLHLMNENRFVQSALRLSDYLNKPGIIEKFNNMDDLMRGMSYQPQKASDIFFDVEVAKYLFRGEKKYGSDLRALDIQRNRDHGLASYNNAREYCGLPRAKCFSDFLDYISPSHIEKLAMLYTSPDDVDLAVGGSLESHVPGTLTGPTFLCILQEQFHRTRVGDRYWFERGDYESAFTLEQLNEIRKSSFARLLCDNGDHITHMQLRAFNGVSATNPIVSCNRIPKVDLSLWKEYTPKVQGTEQYLQK
ncbi:peroxidase [Calliopsis andreniformis]|uniref:peroxidase n=1 Tax=Calliopsis andreniformis TaxID=337506 RepID=UPI003FCE4318